MFYLKKKKKRTAGKETLKKPISNGDMEQLMAEPAL